MEINSAQSSASLRFFAVEGDYFHCTLCGPKYSGTLRVWGYTDSEGLANLFEAFTSDWKRWPKERTWSSTEGELAITCSHDNLGHINLSVRMHHDFGTGEPWRLSASIVVDATQMDGIANDARRFFKT